MKTILIYSVTILACLLSRLAPAATITGDINDTIGYTVASNDLLQTHFGTVAESGNFNKEGVPGMGEAKLRNSSFENTGGQQGATAGNGDSLIYTLDGTYDITGINTYAGWSYGRYGQHYFLSFHLASEVDPNLFTTPLDVSYGPGTGETVETSAFPGNLNGNFSTRVVITDPSGFLATGVDKVKFVFATSPNYVGDYNGYRELDVFGTAVPEPSSFALLGFGIAGLIQTARRRRTS